MNTESNYFLEQLFLVTENVPLLDRSKLNQYLYVVHKMCMAADFPAPDATEYAGYLRDVQKYGLDGAGSGYGFLEADIRIESRLEV